MNHIYINNFSHTLTGAWPAAETAAIPLPPEAMSALNNLSEGQLLMLTLADESATEIVGVSRPGGSLHIERGMEGTAAQLWGDGTVVYASLTAGMLEAFRPRPIVELTAQQDDTIQIDAGQSLRWRITLEGDCTITLPELDAGQTLELYLEQDEEGGHEVELLGDVVWRRGLKFEVEPLAESVTQVRLTRFKDGLPLSGESGVFWFREPEQEVHVIYAEVNRDYYLYVQKTVDGMIHSVQLPPEWYGYGFNDTLALSPDENYVAILNNLSPIAIFDVTAGTFTMSDVVPYVNSALSGVGRFYNGQLYVIDSVEDIVKVDPATGIPAASGMQSLSGLIVSSMKVGNDMMLVTHVNDRSSGGGLLFTSLYDLAEGELSSTQLEVPTGLEYSEIDGSSSVFSPDGEMCAIAVKYKDTGTGGWVEELFIYDVVTRHLVKRVPLSTNSYYGAFSSDMYWSEPESIVMLSSYGEVSVSTISTSDGQIISYSDRFPDDMRLATVADGKILFVSRYGDPEMVVALNLSDLSVEPLPSWLSAVAISDMIAIK